MPEPWERQAQADMWGDVVDPQQRFDPRAWDRARARLESGRVGSAGMQAIDQAGASQASAAVSRATTPWAMRDASMALGSIRQAQGPARRAIAIGDADARRALLAAMAGQDLGAQDAAADIAMRRRIRATELGAIQSQADRDFWAPIAGGAASGLAGLGAQWAMGGGAPPRNALEGQSAWGNVPPGGTWANPYYYSDERAKRPAEGMGMAHGDDITGAILAGLGRMHERLRMMEGSGRMRMMEDDDGHAGR